MRKAYLKPRRIGRTGDDSPAGSVWGYVRRMTGRAQVAAFVLALAATGLALAPIELQRRMIDDAVSAGDVRLLALLGGAYLVVVVVQQVVKFGLRATQSWMSESAVLYTRRHLWGIHRNGRDGGSGERESDRDVVAILTREVEALGGFAGGAPSQAFANVSLLLAMLVYMFWVSPMVAAAGLALLAPQILLTPLMQRRLNRLIEIRLRLMRGFTAAVGGDASIAESEYRRRLGGLYRSRISFDLWKFLMKSALNLLNNLAPLGVVAIGGLMVIRGEATIGVVVAFVSGFSRLGDPIRQLISFYREAAEAEVRHRMIAKWMSP